MRKVLTVCLAMIVAVFFIGLAATGSSAKKNVEKFGEDRRHNEWTNKKWETAKESIVWRMSDPWGDQLLHDIVLHFADSVKACSGGRLEIKVYPTGSLYQGMELFRAVSSGALDLAHSWPGYWRDKSEAFIAFGSVPFGLDFEGYNIWYYERGGHELLNELYGRFGMVAFPCGNAGQDIGLYSNKRITAPADFKGAEVRALGWYVDILSLLGATVTSFPVSEIYLSMDRGLINAFEFGSPAISYPMGFHDVTRYVIEPGVPQPSSQFDVFINKKTWDALPDDLKAIVEVSARETQLWSNSWIQSLNTRAVELIGKNVEFIFLNDEAIVDFARTSFKYLEGQKAKNPDVKRVLESQEKFKEEFAQWRQIRGRMAPWPKEMILKGVLKQ